MGLLSRIRNEDTKAGAHLESATQLEQAGDLIGAIDALMEENRNSAHPTVAREVLRLRHELGASLIRPMTEAPPYPEPAFDALPADGSPLPEFERQELTPGLLRAAILRYGCMLVRQVIPKETASRLADDVETALRARNVAAHGGEIEDGLWEEFEPQPPFDLAAERAWVNSAGGIWAADAPIAMYRFIDQFEQAGLRELITGYLGERAAISINKCTLRKVAPDAGSSWHQDGAFLGEVRALNVWMALSRCGDLESAPGMDLVPRRLEHLVPRGTEGAIFDWSVSPQVASETAGEVPIIRPVFEPGDVLFFDELFLHATAADPAMPNHRFAIESWFFGPSGFPKDYVPLAF
jgi:hypothetical protein